MTLTRRAAITTIGAAAALTVAAPATLASAAPATDRPRATKPTVVLVHGAWADASGWSKVTTALQRDGYTVLAPPNPLRGIAGDSAYLAAFLRQRTTGPVILVGHSYGGAVITNAALSAPGVRALVYVDAFVPDQGETILGLLGGGGDPTAIFDFVEVPGQPPTNPDLYFKTALFPSSFAGDLPAEAAAQMAAAQRPIAFGALAEPSGVPSWKTLPSWYLLGTRDNVVPPAVQRSMAQRAHSHVVEVPASHLAMVSHPHAAAALIVAAARSVQ
ncbi:MAG TPA: alpha/beta hydrolase [Dactylosporangium sp.]|nr:alpha/beta hydrolase [Dactylosporangium sp.]